MPAWMPAARAQQRRQRDEARGTDLPVTRVAQQRPRGLSSDVAADDDAEPTAPPAKLSATRDAFNERGERLNSLAEKTAALQDASKDFASMAKELRKQQESKGIFGGFF